MENVETEIVEVLESSVSNTEGMESVVLQTDEGLQILQEMKTSMDIIVLVVLLTFLLGCFREYRKNFSKGV